MCTRATLVIGRLNGKVFAFKTEIDLELHIRELLSSALEESKNQRTPSEYLVGEGCCSLESRAH